MLTKKVCHYISVPAMNSFIKIIFHLTKFCPVDWLPALHIEYFRSPQGNLNWIYQSFGAFFFYIWIILAFQLTDLWWVWINSEKNFKKFKISVESVWEQKVMHLHKEREGETHTLITMIFHAFTPTSIMFPTSWHSLPLVPQKRPE